MVENVKKIFTNRFNQEAALIILFLRCLLAPDNAIISMISDFIS